MTTVFFWLSVSVFSLVLTVSTGYAQSSSEIKNEATQALKDKILLLAEEHIQYEPITITSIECDRSEGTLHDFYSEGDYWWPDPDHPDGPYIRRDGSSNPENFNQHRELLYRLSVTVGNLASAFVLTGEKQYARAIVKHLQAWFVNKDTRMNPNLHYSQAIKGRCEGRYIGIIDGIHFIEVAQAVRILEQKQAIGNKDLKAVKQWFSDYLQWLVESDYGKEEKAHPNNHGAWWNVQAAMYALLTSNEEVLGLCKQNYKTNLLPNQMAVDGSFPEELSRTKPYAYSIFNLEAMTMSCVILSSGSDNLWKYSTDDGKNIEKAIAFMAPYLRDKSKWPYPPDVMHWNDWPVAMSSTLFGAVKFDNTDRFTIWKNSSHFMSPSKKELIRNVVIRNPVIWFEDL
jgi:hypothetical protein